MRSPASTWIRSNRTRRSVECAVLCLVMWGASASAPNAVAAQTVEGTLVDRDTNRPIPVGLVMMLTEEGDSVTATITDGSGHFSVTSPTPGSFVLRAVALGYRETPAGTFELGEGGVMTVEYRLPPQPLPIDELIVSLDRPVLLHALVRNGFVRRLQRGFGVFITPHDIEESTATSTERLLAGINGIRVGYASTPPRGPPGGLVSVPRPDIGETVQIQGLSRWCAPMVYVDGRRVPYEPQLGLTLSNMAQLGDVEGIEVYRRPAEVPVEYSTGPFTDCGVLVVWTKMGLAAGQAPSRGGDWVAAAGGDPLPSVAEHGSPPEPGESIRMQLGADVRETFGLGSPWEGTFLMVQEDNLIANDRVSGRSVAVPLSGVEALHVQRERSPSYALKKGVISGAAFTVGMWGMLQILCRSVCDADAASTLAPSVATGVLLGFMVKAQGPGEHWVGADVPGPEPAWVGIGLSLPLGRGNR